MKYRKGGKRIFDGIDGMNGIFLGKGRGIFGGVNKIAGVEGDLRSLVKGGVAGFRSFGGRGSFFLTFWSSSSKLTGHWLN